ncbi:MAG: glycosyltransferase family 4 protein [Bacteroidales bacterium]|jgi:glycosyltransferase involved in cell wall biosynthesis|nr:glycosyltransferase family 4 protein [Bacteroidales bacterium]NPV35414.1 glycosyltransferase family 4 protein [Bacteroidales bacterium]
MERVLMISYYWPPSGGPGVQRPLKFVKYLPAEGFDPVVITVDPEKAYYPLLDESLQEDVPSQIKVYRTPTFEPFGIYEKLTGRNKMPKPGFAGEGKPGKWEAMARFIRGNLFVPDPRKGWNRFLIKQALQVIEERRPAAIITSSPPHSTQLAGLKLKRLTHIPWIADMRDPWTDIYYYKEFRHLPWVKKKDATYERQVLEEADAIVVVSEAIKRLFLSKSPSITPEKIHVIPNGFDPSDFPEAPCIENSEPFTIVYTGTLSPDYPIDSLAEAIYRLKENNNLKDIRLHIIGKASPQIHESFHRRGIEHQLILTGYKPHTEAIKHMQCADALLLVIPDVSNNEGILTGKLFEYLATGVPILGLGPVNGDAANILEKAGTGNMFAYNDVTSITNWLFKTIQSRKLLERRPSAAAMEYSRQALTGRLAEIIRSLN